MPLTRSIVGLAHGKGRVNIEREATGYAVVHYDRDGAVVAAGTVEIIQDEDLRDAKARCIAAVGMTMHWPALLASIAADARARPAARPVELEAPAAETTPRLVLPPGFERVQR